MIVKTAILILLCLWSGCTKCSEEKPLALDYGCDKMWFADSTNATAEVDVFYITPTCIWDWKASDGTVQHYMNIDNSEQRAAVDESNRLAAALFTKSCRFYSPYYRQITMNSWMQSPGEIEKRYAVAHKDVVTAFNYYMEHLNAGRPFILAGHSQGAKAVLELLKHTVSEKQSARLVAAYMFGFEVKQSDLDNHKLLKPAKDSLDCGVVVCYNSVSTSAAISPLMQNNVVCINPINWRTDNTYATPKENLGSVFFNENGVSDTIFHKVGAKVNPAIHTVIIDGLSDDDYYIPSIGQIFPKGNYHVQEINLYFLNLQKNIEQRIKTFKQLNDQKIYSNENNEMVYTPKCSNLYGIIFLFKK